MASRMTFVTPAALALALAACGSGNEADAPADVAASDPMATGTPAAAAATATPEFVAMAASGGMYEVESSKLARNQAKNAEVKAFAEMMIKDHTKASDELKAAAGKAAPAVTVPTVLDPKHQGMLDQLKSSKANFDKAYVDQQRAAHEETLALLDGYAAGGDSQPVKEWAVKTKPAVQTHLDKAKELAGKVQ